MKQANVALYARVSDPRQEDNTSLDGQLKACREFAIRQGWTIVKEVREIMSGAFVLARPEFNALLELASKSKVDIIVVDIPDRFGRGDAVAKLELLAEMNGARIAYANRRFDDSTIEGFVQKSTDALVSGIERIKIAERTTNGRRSRAREGRVIASSFRPYGYEIVSEYDDLGKKVGCTMEIVPDEAEVIRQMFHWFVYEQLSIYAIAKKLTEMRIPTLTDTDGRKRAKKVRGPCEWCRSTINNMLRNETYTGVWHYGKRRVALHDGPTVSQVSQKREKDHPNRIAVSVPAIVDRGTWEMAQERFAESKRRGAFKPTKNQYLLRSMVFCARCGSRMTGWTNTYKTGYYKCRRNYPMYYEMRCTCHSPRKDKIEPLVWDYICEIMLDEDELFRQMHRKRQEARQAQKIFVDTIAALDIQDEKDRQRLASLLDLYLEGNIAKDVYLQRKHRIEKALEEREYERADLKARLSSAGALSEENERELRKLRDKIVKGLDKMDFKAKRQLLELLKVRCVWNDETRELTVSGIFGGDKVLSTSS
jgi:site-specific DNA recombinase